MTLLVTLWEEMVIDSGDSSLFSSLGADNHRFFDTLKDSQLSQILGKVKSLLNEPKNREKGVQVFQEFVSALRPQRFQTLQDSLLTILRLLSQDSMIHLPIVHNCLVNFLPHSKNLPDILKELTPKNGLIGRIVVSCIASLQEGHRGGKLPSPELILLLKVCLENFRGSCGPLREKLEGALTPYLDWENTELVFQVAQILPLLSATGGGGQNGSNHRDDWLLMVRKLMRDAYHTLWELYDDSCPSLLEKENPFELKDQPFLKPLTEKKVFLKMLKLKTRLNNITIALNAYLRNAFPAFKPVPVDALLKLVNFILSVNPVELLEYQEKKTTTAMKEGTFLAGLLPSVHSSAFKLLSSIIVSVGTNIFTKAVSVEQLYSQEIRWLKDQNRSYDGLKESLNGSLGEYLKVTGGFVTCNQTLKSWVLFLLDEVEVEKERVELHFGNLGKKHRSKNQLVLTTTTSHQMNGGGLGGPTGYLEKSPEVCQGALGNLKRLLNSTDGDSHQLIVKTISQTQLMIYQQGKYPSPFTSSNCRLLLNELLLELCLEPHPSSLVSLSLVVTSLRKGASSDPSRPVREQCLKGISTLERLFHPMKQGLEMSTGGSGQGPSFSGWDKTNQLLQSVNNANEEEDGDEEEVDSGGDVDKEMPSEDKEQEDLNAMNEVVREEEVVTVIEDSDGDDDDVMEVELETTVEEEQIDGGHQLRSIAGRGQGQESITVEDYGTEDVEGVVELDNEYNNFPNNVVVVHQELPEGLNDMLNDFVDT